MSSLKLVLISTSVLSVAIMLRFSAPALAGYAGCLPSVYNGVVSWLRPPYLYLVTNCIIIIIVASSKLQSRKDEDVSLLPAAATQPPDTTMSADILRPQPVAVKSILTDYEPYKYNGVVLSDSIGYDLEAEKGLPEIDTYEQVDAKDKTAPFVARAAAGCGDDFTADAMSNKENEYVIAKSTWTVPENKGATGNSPVNVKPPVSKRFGHRRDVKASPEGVKTVLGVSKPKKQDTLESTWRTITEGRAMPITRHLKKSDTWERDNHHLHGHYHQQQQKENNKTPQKTMTKAETFNDRTNTRSPSPGSSDGSGKIRREASLSSDELNRRVEAFIKKFNEDMRLQRQESLNQYNEMVSRV